MAKSIYDSVVQVADAYNKVEEKTSVDKKTAIKRLYEDNISNPVVSLVINGNSSFVDELLKYAKGDKTNKQYLEECLGIELPKLSMSGGAIMAGAGIGGLIGMIGTPEITRREMIRIGLFTLPGAGLGALVDFGGKEIKRASLINYGHFERAQFLDSTYRSVK